MPIRRLNYTGRRRILREDARIMVRETPAGKLLMEVRVALDEYDLPSTARVFVEAYRQTSFMRFDHGAVASLKNAPATYPLTEFTSKEGVHFRVKVTSAGDRPGVLLAEADRIPMVDDEEHTDNRTPLLPPASEDLGQETWRIEFGEGIPLLLINSRLGDWKMIARSAVFRSLVYPAALREVLWRIYKIEGTRSIDEEDDDWRNQWLRFAASLPGCATIPESSEDDAEWQEWIDAVVAAFCRRHGLLDHYKASLEETAE